MTELTRYIAESQKINEIQEGNFEIFVAVGATEESVEV